MHSPLVPTAQNAVSRFCCRYTLMAHTQLLTTANSRNFPVELPGTNPFQPVILQKALLPMYRTLHLSLLNLIMLLFTPFLQKIWVHPPSTVLSVPPLLVVTCKLEERALHQLLQLIVRDTKQDRYGMCNETLVFQEFKEFILSFWF